MAETETCFAGPTALLESPHVAYSAAIILCYLLWSKLAAWNVFYSIRIAMEFLLVPVPTIQVDMNNVERLECLDSKPHRSVNIQDPKKPGKIQCYDPSTKQFLGEVNAMTAADVHERCERAHKAQQQWAQTTYAQRRKVLRTIQKYIVQHVEDICRVSTRDSGKPKVDALLGEVLTTCEKIRCINANGELWLRPSYRTTGPMMLHKTAMVEYVPLGIVAPIAPWNYPFHNFMNHIISGIFAGNAVVGKVSEHTSWSSQYFTRIVQVALEVNGHDPNLCQTITGFGDAGAALVSDPLVDKVVFTGSPAIGRKVMETASKYLKPVILELGGKDAMVVLDDAKLGDIVPWVMRGCFQNCGQNCVGIERVLVYESIYDAFCKDVKERVQGLRQGVPLETCGFDANVDCGSMVMDAQIDLIQELVDDAVSKGAKVLVGGERNKKLEGQFYKPTIIVDVTPDMRIFQEELFGPVMTVCKVPNDDDTKCIEMANDSCFGLGSSVFCTDKARGLKIGRQIRSGMMCVNDFGSNYLVQSLPFGGVKDSGFGRFAGIEGLQAMCLERSILIDRIPGVKTTIPPPIDYPIDKKKGLPFGDSLIQLFYNESWIGKLKGIFGLIKFG